MANCEYPTANFFEEEEQFPKKQQRNVIGKNASQRNYANYFQVSQPRQSQQYQKNFSGSSSSSSSSDSEEEFYPMNTKPFKTMMRHERPINEGRQWSTVIDLEGLQTQEVRAKVNTKCRILLIKLKNVQQSQMEVTHRQQSTGDELVRIIRLPENILLEQLRVQVILRAGRIIVKAPFTFRREQGGQQHQGRSLPTWIPIHVTFKNNIDIDAFKGTQHENQIESDLPRNWISKKCFQRFWNSRNFEMEDNQTFISSFPQQMEEDFVSRKWNKKNTMNGGHYKQNTMEGGRYKQNTSRFNSILPITEIIRDETTGKPIMLVKVNVVGFRTEEVRVRVEETQRLLIVEATKRHTENKQQLENEFQMDETLTTKYLRREFILPHFLDVTHIDFRVLKNGLLVVKLPIVKNQKNMQSERVSGCESAIFKKDMETENQLTNTSSEWEKPLRA